jgi:hypothetical protein
MSEYVLKWGAFLTTCPNPWRFALHSVLCRKTFGISHCLRVGPGQRLRSRPRREQRPDVLRQPDRFCAALASMRLRARL